MAKKNWPSIFLLSLALASVTPLKLEILSELSPCLLHTHIHTHTHPSHLLSQFNTHKSWNRDHKFLRIKALSIQCLAGSLATVSLITF